MSKFKKSYKQYVMNIDRNNSWNAYNKTINHPSFNKRLKKTENLETAKGILVEAFGYYVSLLKSYQIDMSRVQYYRSYKFLNSLKKSNFKKLKNLKSSWNNGKFLSPQILIN